METAGWEGPATRNRCQWKAWRPVKGKPDDVDEKAQDDWWGKKKGARGGQITKRKKQRREENKKRRGEWLGRTSCIVLALRSTLSALTTPKSHKQGCDPTRRSTFFYSSVSTQKSTLGRRRKKKLTSCSCHQYFLYSAQRRASPSDSDRA